MGKEQIEKYGVIIQARTSSSRLPKKVVRDLEGQPMLLRQLKRLQYGLNVPKLVVATSNEASDDPIENLCIQNGFNCYRGSLNDVMGRFIQCAQKNGIDYIIRVGGDDPLIDWDCCNTLMELHMADQCDFMYASNREGWPFGCAAELISRKALERVHEKTDNPFYLEHTIPYFFDHMEEFEIRKVTAPEDIKRPEYYFTVDYPADFELISAIFKEFKGDDYFPLLKAIKLRDNQPELNKINEDLHQGFDK